MNNEEKILALLEEDRTERKSRMAEFDAHRKELEHQLDVRRVKVDSGISKLQETLDKVGEDVTEQGQKIEKLEEAHRDARSIVRVFKWLGGMFIALVTLKFGDVSTLWKKLGG